MTKISKQNYTFVQQRGRGNPKPNNPYKILFVKSKRVQKNTKIQLRQSTRFLRTQEPLGHVHLLPHVSYTLAIYNL